MGAGGIRTTLEAKCVIWLNPGVITALVFARRYELSKFFLHSMFIAFAISSEYQQHQIICKDSTWWKAENAVSTQNNDSWNRVIDEGIFDCNCAPFKLIQLIFCWSESSKQVQGSTRLQTYRRQDIICGTSHTWFYRLIIPQFQKEMGKTCWEVLLLGGNLDEKPWSPSCRGTLRSILWWYAWHSNLKSSQRRRWSIENRSSWFWSLFS